LTFGRILKEAVFANIMPTRKKYYWMMTRRNHKFKTNAANICLDLITDFFVQLFILFIVALREWVIHLLDKVGCVILNTIFCI
jgi:hypothetical protein